MNENLVDKRPGVQSVGQVIGEASLLWTNNGGADWTGAGGKSVREVLKLASEGALLIVGLFDIFVLIDNDQT